MNLCKRIVKHAYTGRGWCTVRWLEKMPQKRRSKKKERRTGDERKGSSGGKGWPMTLGTKDRMVGIPGMSFRVPRQREDRKRRKEMERVKGGREEGERREKDWQQQEAGIGCILTRLLLSSFVVRTSTLVVVGIVSFCVSLPSQKQYAKPLHPLSSY